MTEKGILEFDLSDRESRKKFQKAVLADDMALCLWRINDLIFEDKFPTEYQIKIATIMCEYDININELTQ